LVETSLEQRRASQSTEILGEKQEKKMRINDREDGHNKEGATYARQARKRARSEVESARIMQAALLAQKSTDFLTIE